jgi:hypothetical protein
MSCFTNQADELAGQTEVNIQQSQLIIQQIKIANQAVD